MKRGNTALKRGVGLASAFALAIAGAVVAAPAANAAPTSSDTLRAQPIANAVWINDDGSLRTSASATSNTYAANSTGAVPTVKAASNQPVSSIQIAVNGGGASNAILNLGQDDATFARLPGAVVTAQPVDLSKLDNLAGYSGTNATAAPAAAVSPKPADAAKPTVAWVDDSDHSSGIKVTWSLPVVTGTAGYLITLSNVRVDIATNDTLADDGGAVSVTDGTSETTVAFVAPFSMSVAATSADRSYAGNVSLPTVTLSELATNAVGATCAAPGGALQWTVTSDPAPASGAVKFAAGTITFTLPDGKTLNAPIDNQATKTVDCDVLKNFGGVNYLDKFSATKNDSISVSGLVATNVPAGANVIVSLTDPVVAAINASGARDFSSTPDLAGASVSVATAAALPRIAGNNRYETAQDVAKQFVASNPTPDSVVIANGIDAKNGVDALAANYLAGATDSPILLTQADTLPSATQFALLTVFAGTGLSTPLTVYVMGKTDSVSQAVADQIVSVLKAAGHSNVTVKRVAGDNRYETSADAASEPGAAEVAAYLLKGGSSYLNTAFLASGTNNADALAAGAISYSAHIPVLLTNGTALDAKVSSAIKDLGIQQVIVLGATDRVSDDLVASLKDLGVTNTLRVAGTDRYDTAAQLAELNWTTFGNKGTQAFLSNGITGWADALSVGPLAGSTNSPLLTVPANSLPSTTKAFLTSHKADLTDGVEALGKSATIADSVITAAQDALK